MNWVKSVENILRFIAANKVPFAEIVLTVKSGAVVFVDYRGPLRQENEDE